MNPSTKLIIPFLTFVIGLNIMLLTLAAESAEWQTKYPYQQMRENFKEPPLFYAPHTFWFWDAPLDKVVAASMAKEMTTKRLNPGYAHPRHSGAQHSKFPSLPLEEWLSPKWFESFEASLSAARSAGMTLGYCDEYWWPSGQAAGRVLKKNPDLAAQSLDWQKQILEGPAKADLIKAKFAVAAKLSAAGKIIPNTLQLIGENERVTWAVPDGKWVVFSYNTYHHPGVDGGEVNYLDDRLMDTFIPIAHESYESHFRDQMGVSIPGVFVDNEGDFGWKMAWSDYLVRRYSELKGRDIRLWLPLLTEEDEAGLWAKARYDWFDVVSDVYTHQYLGRLSDWLKERNMYCISNLWEEDLMLQTRAVGDFMRAQRAVTMPGNDCLQMKSQQVHDFKETQSVCEFEDKPFMSELMGVAGWEQTPVQMKMTLNSVTAFGVTHTVPHGINLNRQLETIPYPADWYTENPYWQYLQLWTDFARRASFVNRQGRLVADILLINPLESVWALSEGYFTSTDGNTWPETVHKINDVYASVIHGLTARRLDYLIADRHYMDGAEVIKSSTQKNAQLRISEHDFSVLVLPPVFILARNTANKILSFAQAGGHVFILGDLPGGSPETGAVDPEIISKMERLIQLPTVYNLAGKADKADALADMIEEIIPVQVKILRGELPLTIAHRIIGKKNFYWIVNNTEKKENVSLSFRDAAGRAEIWDCEYGDIFPVPGRGEQGRMVTDLEIEPYESFWLVFDPEKSALDKKAESEDKFREISITEPWLFSLPQSDKIETTSARTFITTDTNNVEDFLDPDFDDSGWKWLNITGPLRITDQWRASLFINTEPESDRYYRYKFVLKDSPDGALVNLNADNELWFWVNGKFVQPGPNASSLTDPDLHDIGSLLKKGENIICVKTTNHPGYGSMIFQGTVLLKDGSTFDILSGPEWKESKTEIQGWQNPDFDDSQWAPAQLAEKQLQERDLQNIRDPFMASFTGSVAWWRMKLPPAVKSVRLPGLSESARVWVDGRAVKLKDYHLEVPENSRILVVKIFGNTNGLTGQVSMLCQGSGKVQCGSWLDMGLRNFTGFGDYEVKINLPAGISAATLELGKVLHMAEVWMNGHKVGERLWPPFKFDLGEFARAGENTIRVRIGNLMVNSMGIHDDLGTLRHWGWQGVPPDVSFDAGLFGPVKIFYKN